jgi:hypothetical protein
LSTSSELPFCFFSLHVTRPSCSCRVASQSIQIIEPSAGRPFDDVNACSLRRRHS